MVISIVRNLHNKFDVDGIIQKYSPRSKFVTAKSYKEGDRQEKFIFSHFIYCSLSIRKVLKCAIMIITLRRVIITFHDVIVDQSQRSLRHFCSYLSNHTEIFQDLFLYHTSKKLLMHLLLWAPTCHLFRIPILLA